MSGPIPASPLQWPAGWPRCSSRRRAQFSRREAKTHQWSDGSSSSYSEKRSLSIADATKRVLYELERLGVQHGDAVISTNLKLKLDGLPYSNQSEPQDPGVAVYWRRRRGQEMRVMAIDHYDRVADNLAAIAATLEAMRAIERHGGAQILERAFTGFDALPPPRGWAEILAVPPNATREQINEAFRRLAGEHHPDRGGSHDRMAEISRARDDALRHSP